jgi:flagellar protein FliL
MKLPIPKGRKAILLLGVPLGLAAAGGFGFMMMSGSKPTPAVPDPGAGEHGVMLALESRVINLTLKDSTDYKYAKIAITIELRPTAASFYALDSTARAKQEKVETDKVADSVPLLLDALGSTVSAHSSSTLTTPEGLSQLKSELLVAMRKVLGDKTVLNVYFTDFVMQ